VATPEEAEALKQVLGDISTLVISDLVGAWRRFDGAPNMRDLFYAVFPEIIAPHAETAAEFTAAWYESLAPHLRYDAFPVVNLPAERMLGSLDWAFDAPGEATPLERITGSSQRMIFDASRDTVIENLTLEYGADESQPAGTRWARYASANACSFCRLLATRGAEYRSAESAVSVVGRGTQLTNADRRQVAQGVATADELLALREQRRGGRRGALRGGRKHGDKYHDNCRCVAVPVRPGETYTPPPYVRRWEQEYERARQAAIDAGERADLKTVVKWMDRGSD